MDIMIDDVFLEFAKNKLKLYLKKFGIVDDEDCEAAANDLIKTIDWDNPTLMHKGFSGIARNYISSSLVL